MRKKNDRQKVFDDIQWITKKGKERMEKAGVSVFLAYFKCYEDGGWAVQCETMEGKIVVAYAGDSLADFNTMLFRISNYGLDTTL